MKSTYLTPLSKAVLTGLFVGIVATVICLLYNIFYRDSTGFPLSNFINVSSLIFAVNLLFLVIGFVYYAFLQANRKGEIAFVIFFLLLTIYFTLKAAGIHRSDNPVFNSEFHQLLEPMIIFMGLAAAIGIPFLYHNEKFEEVVL
jgi:hypothetical protein